MHSLDRLTAADFAPLRNEHFTLTSEQATPLELELVDVTGVDGAGGRPFSVVFRGPRDPQLPQRIYLIEHPALGPLELFIVPIRRDAAGVSYEAVFS